MGRALTRLYRAGWLARRAGRRGVDRLCSNRFTITPSHGIPAAALGAGGIWAELRARGDVSCRRRSGSAPGEGDQTAGSGDGAAIGGGEYVYVHELLLRSRLVWRVRQGGMPLALHTPTLDHRGGTRTSHGLSNSMQRPGDALSVGYTRFRRVCHVWQDREMNFVSEFVSEEPY